MDIVYNQVFIERISSFFYVDIEEDLFNSALDKWAEIKSTTEKKLKNAMDKKNIISLVIKPRRLIIPINRYDLINSKWLQLQIGDVSLKNEKINGNIYEEINNLIINSVNLLFFENFKNLQNNENGFKIIYDTKLSIGIAILPKGIIPKENPLFKLFVDIKTIKIQTTEYIFTLLSSLNEILK